MMGLSDLAVMCALAAGAVGVGGGVYHGTVWPALVGCSFTAVFWSTLRLHEKRRTTMMTQALLVLLLVMLSFALHLIFLPAGICCFFAMICVKNELRAAPSRNRAARPRPLLDLRPAALPLAGSCQRHGGPRRRMHDFEYMFRGR